MDKKHDITGLVQPENLPFPAVPITEKMAEQIIELCSTHSYGPKISAEAMAQTYSLKETEALLEWMQKNRTAPVYCPGYDVMGMMEAVAICAQGASRIEHAVQYVYHHCMMQNLITVYETHSSRES